MGQTIAVIGAGIGGLVAALRLSVAGARVIVLEAAGGPGGKMRTLPSAAGPVDAGPTVLTLAPLFERLFAEAGEALSDHVTLDALPCLARHYWDDGTRLDLFADPQRNRAEIADVFGPRAARQFDAFAARARRLFDAFDAPMMQAAEPSQTALAAAVLRRPRLIADMAPGRSLAGLAFSALSEPKLAQLVARFATYVGGSPWAAPALLSLIWDAEARGVWAVRGGMNALARAIAELAADRGVEFRYDCKVARITLRDGCATGVETAEGHVPADAVVFNGDPRALAMGFLGAGTRAAVRPDAVAPRSLSAHVASFAARPTGPDLAYHTVFFGHDPRAEFAALEAGRVPADATLYVCAQDRAAGPPPALERFEIIRNAPPLSPEASSQEPAPCPTLMTRRLAAFGLHFDPAPGAADLTGPAAFDALFPASLGSLYGRSPKGLTAALKRPRARSRVPGLYLCGGGTHPGAGVPMAALSGRHAAEAIATDLAFTSTCRPTDMPGGMSTASRRTESALSRSSASSAPSSRPGTPGAAGATRKTTSA